MLPHPAQNRATGAVDPASGGATDGATNFEDAVWAAVSLGHDADTVGAVAGALAGARWGAASIPDRLKANLTSLNQMFVDEYPGALESLARDLASIGEVG